MIEEQFFSDLAGIVIYHRKKSQLNRVELGRLAGVGKTVIYDIEHAKQTVKLNTLLKVLNTLNIKIEFKGPLMQTYRAGNHETS